MARFLELAPVMCIRDFMSGWFRGAPFSEIRRGNVEDFVAYGFYQSTWAGLGPAEAAAAAAFVDDVQATWGVAYPPGRNEGLSFMAHLWEPLRAVPKPLAVHAAAEVGVLSCRALLWGMGFRRRAVGGGSFDYWVRPAGGRAAAKAGRAEAGEEAVETEEAAAARPATPPPPPRRRAAAAPLSNDGSTSSVLSAGVGPAASPIRPARAFARGDSFTSVGGAARDAPAAAAAAPTHPPSPSPRPRPIAFIHDVGLGIFPYLGLIWQMVATHGGARDVLLLEVPHVALGAAPRRAATVDAVADAAVAMLRAEGHGDALFAAHSYGTFCVSRACQRHPGAVAAALLIDPVCLLTCHPRLLYHFVYHSPGLAALFRGGLREVLGGVRYLFSRDLTIAETFCRQFLWHELTLWPHDMPAATLVALAHGDDLVPSPLVARHLAASAPGARVLYHPTAGHGGVLLDWAWQKGLVDGMGPLLDAPARGAGAGLAVARKEAAAVAAAAGAAATLSARPSPRPATLSAADDTAGEGDAQPGATPTAAARRRHHRRPLISAGARGSVSDDASPRRLFRRLTVKQASGQQHQPAAAAVAHAAR